MIVLYLCFGLCLNALAGALFYGWLDNDKGDLLAIYQGMKDKPFQQFLALSLWWFALYLCIKVAIIRAGKKK